MRRARGFQPQPRALRFGGQHPTGLGKGIEIVAKPAGTKEKPDLTFHLAGAARLDRPLTKPDNLPMARIAQKRIPAFGLGFGLAGNMGHHGGRGPDISITGEVFGPHGAQGETGGIDGRY